MNRKTELLNAFVLEAKASECYDKVYASFSEAEKENIQATLISIFFTGEKQYKHINDKYRKDASSLAKEELKYIQAFHRSAMAFSRRKAKECDDVDDMVQSLNQSKPANGVSSPSSSKKESSISSDTKETKTRQGKPKNPELLITEAMELITRPDVKAILMLALQQMKLSTTITDFTEPADMSFIPDNFNEEDDTDEEVNGVWW